MEMADKQVGQRFNWIRAQRPLAIYVPPQRMQFWQSGRSRAKINRIRARHPGIDIDILKQYKLVYEWIRGKNLIETFEHIKIDLPDIVHHLQAMQKKAFDDLSKKGYHMADMKPEHVILDEEDAGRIEEAGRGGESTGGRMWVVGRNARLFDYFLPERWRKTPSLSLSDANEVYYTVTKDNIHLVWETSRVGEIPTDKKYSEEEIEKIRQYG